MIIKYYDKFILSENLNTFKEYLMNLTKNSNGYIWGILNENEYPDFFICDLDFNLVFKKSLYNKEGIIDEEIINKINNLKISFYESEMQSDLNLNSLKQNLILNFNILKSIDIIKNKSKNEKLS